MVLLNSPVFFSAHIVWREGMMMISSHQHPNLTFAGFILRMLMLVTLTEQLE